MNEDLEKIAGPILSALGLALLKIILNLFITGKISIDSFPLAQELGITNRPQAAAFLKEIQKDAIV